MATQSTTQTTNELKGIIGEYLVNTHSLNDYNEINSVNTYLDERTNAEQQKLRATLDRLNSTLLKLKQEYMLRRYDISALSLKTKIMTAVTVLVSIMIVLLIFYTDGTLGKNLLTTIIFSVTLVFIAIVYLIIRSNSFRVETNWDAYYWGPVKQQT